MSRLSLAFKSFFQILFGDGLSEEVARAFGYVKETTVKPAPVVPEVRISDGALQLLGILQRDARLVDFLMEDVSPYTDEQVGAAFRQVNEQGRACLTRYASVAPIIDGVANTRVQVPSQDAATVKLIGNVPASGKASAGLLRHNGWRVQKIELPKLSNAQNVTVLAPAEIEIE